MAQRFSLPRIGLARLGHRGRFIAIAAAFAVALVLLLTVGVDLYADRLWFSEVGFTSVWSTVLITRITLFVVFGAVAALIVGGNIALAYRLRPNYRPISPDQQNLERYRLAITPRFGLIVAGVSTLVGIIVGLTAQAQWRTALLFLNSESFGVKDPQFGKDISFYVFQYPFWRYGLSVLFTTVSLAIIGALVIHYLYGNLRLGGSDAINSSMIGHLSGLLGAFVLLKAVAYYFDRFGLLTSAGTADRVQGGASAVDVEWLIPAKNILMWIAALCALAAIVNVGIRRVLLPAMALVLLLISAVMIGGVVPALASQFSIKPNAIDAEAQYIKRNIDYSRKAYGIEQIERSSYTPQPNEAPADIRNDRGTIPNARLLDPSVVSDTYVQRQQVRSFYDFNDKLDIDRYTVDGKIRDYVVGARELNTSQLSGSQRNWINLHTVYTHGNELVVAPANQVDGAGLPIFASGALGEPFESEQAKEFAEAVPVKQPRIYYGELMSDYSIVGKKPGDPDREFDRPTVRGGETSEQVSNTYDGSGGVELSSFGRRLAYAAYFKEKNLLLSNVLHDDSKVLYVRDPRSRVEKVAPFLTLDGDSYPAVVNGKIVWIIDGYTTSNAYPYSQHQELGEVASDSLTGRGTQAQSNNQISYIRNSVKATVDAYDGTVKLYQWDTTDPILKAWNKAFDGIVEPKSKIPPKLAEHFRYPEDMFKVQRQAIATYHVGDPREFFNGQDFWKVPDDPTQRGDAPQPPYYLLSQWPGQQEPTFQLTSAMTAARRENLAALISASYDDQGRPTLSMLELPGDSSIPGPNQAQPSMRNDADVRRELSLLTSADSTVVYGNLLTLPVGQGLLYIEPIYVRNTGTTTYPLLERVLVLYGDDVAYEKTLPEALDKLFGEQSQQPEQQEEQPRQPEEEQPQEPEQPESEQNNPETEAAVADIKQALEALRKAQQDGDFTGIGNAQSDLAAAVKRFEDAENRNGG
jgi:uncharacterized membrane protein (UPF0182 family)